MKSKKCLILESHSYETGFSGEQIQIPMSIAKSFFGRENKTTPITVNVFLVPARKTATYSKKVSISKVYKNKTRRINGFYELSDFHSSFVFIEQTVKKDTYDVWFSNDKAIIAAKFTGWKQGKNSQHNRGRLAIIVNAPVDRTNNRI